MRGDILIISEQHRKAARELAGILRPKLGGPDRLTVLTIAGESGAGKSEIAYALSQVLEEEGFPAYIIQQDDFFVYPPKTNARKREEDIRHVGPGEVRLDLLDQVVEKIAGGEKSVIKPLVIFEEDRISEEQTDAGDSRVVIVEGTYTTLLTNADFRIFIDRNYHDTREDRLKRNREKQDAWLESILEIEHGIISRHKEKADIIISKEFEAFLP